MKVSKLVLLMVCAVALFTLTGCFGGGEGSSSSSGGGSGSSYAGGSGSSGGSGGSTGGTLVATAHNPEPATLALVGGGLIAYALSRRKKRK